MANVKVKKCSKVVPILLTVIGGLYGLAGDDGICGFLWFVAFFAFAFCKLIDSCNEVPDSSVQPVSGNNWFEQDQDEDLFLSSRTEFMKSDVGPTGAERVFFGPEADMQPTSSIFESRQLFPRDDD